MPGGYFIMIVILCDTLEEEIYKYIYINLLNTPARLPPINNVRCSSSSSQQPPQLSADATDLAGMQVASGARYNQHTSLTYLSVKILNSVCSIVSITSLCASLIDQPNNLPIHGKKEISLMIIMKTILETDLRSMCQSAKAIDTLWSTGA